MKELKISSKQQICNVSDILNAAVSASRIFNDTEPWWRGHACADWMLMAHVYRGLPDNFEINANGRFVQRARTRHENLPPTEAAAAWLFLMQHYGLPTRLLDWSSSILTAVYFAVSNETHGDQSAALWALRPAGLNKSQIQIGGIVGVGRPEVRAIVNAAFRKTGKDDKKSNVAIGSDQIDSRMMVQQSEFTIHGNNTPLEDLEQAEDFLLKFEIPAKAKNGLAKALGFFGITRSNLFPDLENLSRDLVRMKFASSED